ncbi:MAG TPA: DUF2270 domain-containing protein [Pyrinomonadaceae bacterium]|nr:DUF2270 domain-containing protein [Pyrinomonadaceae bacterium]
MKPETRLRTPTGSLAGGERQQQNTGSFRPPVAQTKETTAAAAVTSSTAATTTPDKSPDSFTLLGRKISPAEFNTAMVHFYRGEVQRSNTWRNRLDTTTNWAVLTAGATLSFAFSSAENPHFVIPINSVLVAFFLFMEARRYRYYEIWASRVRVLETGYFAQMLSPSPTQDQEWAEHLAADMRTPHFTISEWEAVGRRLRRNYLWIFILLAVSWNLKVYLHPFPARGFDMFIQRAGIGSLSGEFMLLFGLIFNAVVFIFAFATVRLKQATGEVLPDHEFPFHPIRSVTSTITRATAQRRVTERRTKRARQRTRTTRPAGATGSLTGHQTGEWKRPDTGELRSTDREPVTEETLT